MEIRFAHFVHVTAKYLMSDHRCTNTRSDARFFVLRVLHMDLFHIFCLSNILGSYSSWFSSYATLPKYPSGIQNLFHAYEDAAECQCRHRIRRQNKLCSDSVLEDTKNRYLVLQIPQHWTLQLASRKSTAWTVRAICPNSHANWSLSWSQVPWWFLDRWTCPYDIVEANDVQYSGRISQRHRKCNSLHLHVWCAFTPRRRGLNNECHGNASLLEHREKMQHWTNSSTSHLLAGTNMWMQYVCHCSMCLIALLT